jgi:Fe-S cluster biosynthesis and repair protein YggX
MADLKGILGDAYKDGMTVEEISAALEKVDLHAGYIKKETFDKTASEAADWKKKHNALLSEEERKEAERLENQKKIEEELNALRKEKTVSDSKAKFIGLGYDAKLAEETAVALADGNMDLVFANQAKFIEVHDKAIKTQQLNNTPTPGTTNTRSGRL